MCLGDFSEHSTVSANVSQYMWYSLTRLVDYKAASISMATFDGIICIIFDWYDYTKYIVVTGTVYFTNNVPSEFLTMPCYGLVPVYISILQELLLLTWFNCTKARVSRLIIPAAQRSCWGGGGGILVSFRPSVRPSRISCALCSTQSPGVKLFAKFQNLNFWHFFKFYNFDFVLFWLGIWCESLVWVIMGRRRYLRTQAF